MEQGNKLNKGNKMEFEKKIKRLESLHNQGWNYLDNLKKSYRLTNGFWNQYGYKMDSLINDLWNNYNSEYVEYLKNKGCYYESKLDVSDFFC